MTQEDKELLLKDLCTRLPYGLKVKCGNTVTKEICELVAINVHISSVSIKDRWAKHYLENVAAIKPYLRPMSSMTEEEERELKGLLPEVYDFTFRMEELLELIQTQEIPFHYIDWLNAHHFDYRDLIEKGLALEAPEDMYQVN